LAAEFVNRSNRTLAHTSQAETKPKVPYSALFFKQINKIDIDRYLIAGFVK
jgi:hypothetical protein